ncbi:MAG: MoaD family protein [Candidatus Schekmanbacteria bacterium]|nr:MoaD family protein [Candidatus Schekmanbacteria bacterium]
MAVKVKVPTPLQKIVNNQAELSAEAIDIKNLIDNLDAAYPGLKERICDESGKIRRFVNIYVNGEDIRFLQADKTVLKNGDEVSIIPAIAGGR